MRINDKDLSGLTAEAYTIAIGNISRQRKYRKSNEALMKILDTLDGFYGVNPQYPHGTLLLFNSEYNAKSARNILKAKGVLVGDNICKVLIPKEYAQAVKEHEE